jgi:hypothetical protein
VKYARRIRKKGIITSFTKHLFVLNVQKNKKLNLMADTVSSVVATPFWKNIKKVAWKELRIEQKSNGE